MMAPADDDGESHVAEEPQESDPLTKQTPDVDNQRDERGASRRLSDAARRDELEAQRSEHHKEKQRRSLLNNRFLQRSEPSATSRSAPGSPPRRPERKEKQQEPQEEEEELSPRIIEEKALVVTRRRSSAASSAAAIEKAKRERGASPRTAAAIVVRPERHVIPALALTRSKWTRELDEDAACGLFVDHERRELAQIASSTLVRLEDRLRRETPTSTTRLNDLVCLPSQDDDSRVVSSFHSLAKPTRPLREAHTTERAQPWSVAILEITIDRLVLDDHASFSLADRVETQLRSLYVSYTHLLHAQPWASLLQRVDAYVDARLVAADRATQAWKVQTMSDTQMLLQSLGSLQQLHYQLLAKWHELQDCYRQPIPPARPVKLRVDQQPRAQSLSLATVRAFLELDHDEADDDAFANLTKRLDELETKDQYLHTVLTLQSVVTESTTSPSSASPSQASLFHAFTLRSCLAHRSMMLTPPKFYVALFINDKEVGRTKAASWTTRSRDSRPSIGVVHLDETLRTQLHFFPDSVSLRVFERGLLVDSVLSTTAIPLLVPGHDLATTGTLSEPRHRVAAASLAPSIEWYQFSSVRPIARSRWHASFLNSSLFTNFQRHPHGRVRVYVAWVAPPTIAEHEDHKHPLETTQVVIPPRRQPVAARGNAKLIGPRIDRRQLFKDDNGEQFGRRAETRGFSYERDFLVHVADDVLDRNDPQNAAVVRLQDHVHAQSSLLQRRDIFRAAALVYDADLLRPSSLAVGVGPTALTRRNLLLQLRDREHMAKHGTSMTIAATLREPTAKIWDHDVFDEPIPLSEHVITRNAKFLSLLRPELPAFDLRQRLDDALAAGGEAQLSLERERKLQQLRLQAFVDRVRASHVARAHRQAQASAGQQRTKTLATILQEQPMPLLPGAFDLSGLGNLFSRRRRLRPRVEQRSAPATMADWPRRCTVYVQVKGATNVPVRVAATKRETPALPKTKAKRGERGGGLTDDEDDDTPGETEVKDPANSSHIFVEISFQGRRRRTTSTHAHATGAVWMETAAFPFHAPQDDWSPDSLQKTPDVIRLSLFDQLVRTSTSDASDDAFLMANRKKSDTDGVGQTFEQQKQRVQLFHQENRYLGCLEIPFTTLYHNQGTLDATLRCEMPVVNVGYGNAKHATSSDFVDAANESNPTVAGVERDDDGVLQSSREATFLSVMMTLDPLLPMPIKAFEENVISASDDYAMLAAYASQWTKSTQSMNAATRHRDFHVFAHNLAHGQTFLTRYVAPQMPPPLSVDKAKRFTVTQLVRFVRMIPFLDDWQLFDGGGELDVWTTSQELLELNAGDFEEHAVLLCNYLNWLDRDEVNLRSFLVLATAVPEGKTVYVLRQDSYKIPQRSILWNASTGAGYSVTDDRCPVLDISLVVSSDNIYANMQPRKRLSEMSWDIETNTKAWKPFFHGAHKKEHFTLPSVQTPSLTYAETPPELVKQVEVELREALKLEIRRWRSVKYTTTFNMDTSLKLRSELERLELALLYGSTRANGRLKTPGADEKDLIQELQRTRRVSGLPLNTTFTDLNKIIAMVQNTNIYWNDHAQVEFGLAVYVHAYPNCVLSVWVYLVALEPLD